MVGGGEWLLEKKMKTECVGKSHEKRKEKGKRKREKKLLKNASLRVEIFARGGEIYRNV